MNVFTFTGRLGNNAEKRATPSGTSVATFSVAVESGYGDQKKTTWVRCALWGKRAEGNLVQFLTKGQLVGVSGELFTREYESKGENKTSVEVNVGEINLLGGKPESAEPKQQAAKPAPTGIPTTADFDDDIPF